MENEEVVEKVIDDYEYTIRVERVEGDNVLLLLEEVDGNDGFGVDLPLAEVEQLLSDPMQLQDRLQPYVEERIQLLKQVKQNEEMRKAREEQVKERLKHINKFKLKKDASKDYVREKFLHI